MRKHAALFAGLLLLARVLSVAGGVHPAMAQDTADLSITKEADRSKLKIGENVVYTITLTNLGPDPATGIVFGDAVPDPLNLVAFACSPQGQGIIVDGIVNPFCSVASLEPGASVTAILVATPISNLAKSERRITNTAFIEEAATPDPDSENNSASVTIRVIGRSR
jgi:uncharacterized repeat protein (TIGR01451 family)